MNTISTGKDIDGKHTAAGAESQCSIATGAAAGDDPVGLGLPTSADSEAKEQPDKVIHQDVATQDLCQNKRWKMCCRLTILVVLGLFLWGIVELFIPDL
jgi:hypothetical protein